MGENGHNTDVCNMSIMTHHVGGKQRERGDPEEGALLFMLSGLCMHCGKRLALIKGQDKYANVYHKN